MTTLSFYVSLTHTHTHTLAHTDFRDTFLRLENTAAPLSLEVSKKRGPTHLKNKPTKRQTNKKTKLGLALTNSVDCKTQDTFECRAFLPAPLETNGQNVTKTETKHDRHETKQTRTDTQHSKKSLRKKKHILKMFQNENACDTPVCVVHATFA